MKKNKNYLTRVAWQGMLSRVAKLLPVLVVGVAVLSCTSLFAQTINVSNSFINISSGAYVVTAGGVILQNSGSIDNTGTIKLGGDWTNNANGLINSSAGLVEFDGSSNQTI